MEATLTRVTEVFRDLFGDEKLAISRTTTARDIPDWDSVMHVSLVMQLEKAFGVRFLSTEIGNLQSVGELVDLIDAKGALDKRRVSP
jgi:acyl carrier protein